MDDIRQIVAAQVAELTKYAKRYTGRVESLPDDDGVIQVSIPELGWETQDTFADALPCQIGGITTPEIGQRVEVYFPMWNPDEARYAGIDGEYRNSQYDSFDKNTDVIYENKKTGDRITYGKSQKKLDVLMTGDCTISINGNTIETSDSGLIINGNLEVLK